MNMKSRQPEAGTPANPLLEPADTKTADSVWREIMAGVQPVMQRYVDADSFDIPPEEITPSDPGEDLTDPEPAPVGLEGDAALGLADSAVAFTETELLALTEGWKPQAQYQGDPEKWIPADQFLAKKPLYVKLTSQDARIAQQEQMIQQLQDLVTGMVQHNLTKSQAEVDSRVAELNQIREHAFKTGDFEAYETATAEMNTLRGGERRAPVAAAPPPPRVTAPPKLDEAQTVMAGWMAKHKAALDRPEVDRVAAAVLQNAIESSTAPNQKDRVRIALVHAEKALQQLFPQHFKPPAAPPAPARGGMSAQGAVDTRSRVASTVAKRMDAMLQTMKSNQAKRGK